MQGFLGLKVGGGGLNLQIWDLNPLNGSCGLIGVPSGFPSIRLHTIYGLITRLTTSRPRTIQYFSRTLFKVSLMPLWWTELWVF